MFKKLWHKFRQTNRGIFLLLQWEQLQTEGLRYFVHWNALLLNAWIRQRINRRHYRALDESALLATRKSDTVFLFAPGYSLNDIPASEWDFFQQHDILGFSGFLYQKWVRVDYYLIRSWVEFREGTVKWRASTLDFAKTLKENPRFQTTTYILQGEYLAQFCNSLIGYKLLSIGSSIYRYWTNRIVDEPTHSLKDGLRHNSGTLSDVVNFAYCMGWKHIVLVGVDLYDTRYFWLQPDETHSVDEKTGTLVASKHSARGQRYDQPHSTVNKGVIDMMGQWHSLFKQNGVHMSVYNPKSLLAQVMPTYSKNKDIKSG